MVQKTVRAETAAVFLHASTGEFLRYQVSFLGAQGLYSIVDTSSHSVLLSHMTGAAARDWPMPMDQVFQHTNHTATFHFLQATQYTYRVDLHQAGGGHLRTLIDIDYASNNSSDVTFQNLDVTSV
jgi:hypothetical protein